MRQTSLFHLKMYSRNEKSKKNFVLSRGEREKKRKSAREGERERRDKE